MTTGATDPIVPGATMGILGSGQLGRMLGLCARRMGYRVQTFSPAADTPTGHLSDVEWTAPYEDLDQVRAFAQGVDVVTFEFENVPAATASAVAEIVPVRPRGDVLHVTQNRLREKGFLSAKGFPVPAFQAVDSEAALAAGIAEIGTPCVLKTAGWGYDGKGQQVFRDTPSAAQIKAAWQSLGGEGILEAFVDFSHEASVVAARGLDAAFVHYGLFENRHRDHILDVTLAPATLPPETGAEAVRIAEGILDALDVVGVLCVEFFVLPSGRVLVNELAPRPHNSGHVTIDAHVSSQFEQQLRAVCGLPLARTRCIRPGAMANLLGDLWQHGEPDWRAACAFEEVCLHLYGKTDARRGRKMGHVTALGETVASALDRALAARRALSRSVATTPIPR